MTDEKKLSAYLEGLKGEIHSTPSVNPETSGKQCVVIDGYPFVGVAPELLFDTIGLLHRSTQKYPGELVALNLGSTKIYLVTHPNDVQYVFSTKSRNFEKGVSKKSSPWALIKPLAGNGIILSDGETWTRNRRMMQPSFTPKKIEAMADNMIATIIKVLPRLDEVAAKPSIDIGGEMVQITQRVLLETIFGSNIPQQKAVQVAQTIKEVVKQIHFRMLLLFLPKYLPLPGEQAFKHNISIIRNTVLSIIHNRRASGEFGNDLLSLLLQAQDEESQTGMDDEQLLDECINLFIAGYDTTSTTLSWLWYLLNQHPKIEDKLREEIDTFIGGRIPTFADLPQLKYTRMIIQETMRLYPAGWGVPRTAIEDDCINGYQIAGGSIVLACPYLTHRLPKFWEQPEVFNPERFTPERIERHHPFAYYPFGGGPRRCIGEHFAMMNMQLIVVMVLQKWRLRCVTDRKVAPKAIYLTVSPQRSIRMTLQRI